MVQWVLGYQFVLSDHLVQWVLGYQFVLLVLKVQFVLKVQWVRLVLGYQFVLKVQFALTDHLVLKDPCRQFLLLVRFLLLCQILRVVR